MNLRLLCLMLLTTAGVCGEAAAPAPEPVEITVTGFKAKLREGKVFASWRRYKPADFKAYQVVKAATLTGSFLPAGPVICSASQPDVLDCQDGALTPGSWFYRLHILTTFGDVWASPAIRVDVGPAQARRPAPGVDAFEW
jgi:hypothetical protein